MEWVTPRHMRNVFLLYFSFKIREDIQNRIWGWAVYIDVSTSLGTSRIHIHIIEKVFKNTSDKMPYYILNSFTILVVGCTQGYKIYEREKKVFLFFGTAFFPRCIYILTEEIYWIYFEQNIFFYLKHHIIIFFEVKDIKIQDSQFNIKWVLFLSKEKRKEKYFGKYEFNLIEKDQLNVL